MLNMSHRGLLIAFFGFFICCVGSAEEIDLSYSESSFYSPNGEDGVFARIFASIKPLSRLCVECGARDGITNSLTHLLRSQGWKSVLFDRSFDIPSLSLYKEFLTPNNVNAIFEKYSIPDTFDLLTIDLGYNDFYIWQALDQRYRPYVICISYNAIHPPNEDKIVLAHPFFCGDNTDYFGASILALYRLGRSKGYALIYAEQSGSHLFFIREDLLEKNQLSFKNLNDVNALYHPLGLGQPKMKQNPKGRKYVSSHEVMKQ